MTHVITCDFCGEPIDQPAAPFAQLIVNVHHRDGDPPRQVFRDYHAGACGDEASCVARALRLLDGGRDVESGLVTGWDQRTPLAELDLQPRVVRVLRGAGVDTVAQLEDLRALGGLAGVRGIGARALDDIDRVLTGATGEQR